MSDDKLFDQIHRATRAEALLKDELLQEVFTELEHNYISAWKAWKADDTAGRERLWQAVNIIGKVKEHLQIILSNGKLAKADLDKLTGTTGRGRKAA